MTGLTSGTVPTLYTYPTPPPNNISDAVILAGQLIFDLSDAGSNSLGLYFMKNGSVGSQNWMKLASYAEVVAMSGSRSQSTATRSLNSAFQVSSSRDADVYYSVDIICSLSLTGGQSGTVFLEICPNSAFTTGVQELGRILNGNSGTLTVGLGLTQDYTGQVSGYVPAGYYVRLRTANNTGTPTFSYKSGQEILL